ncbi:hypothetical protein T07_3376 [Trichinella nelsoni]|uniref:Uncharacterized protein n=1 Tax=Trichinella nelsoni TaxID=6336 RepID=A0A0V0SFX4_9BILA|nr:hypothetical protein T07_3376 [Trichinella nelsoni]
MCQYLYPYISNRLLAPVYRPQRHGCTTLNVPSMPQVFMAASSLMLPAVEKIRICFEALCVNKNAFPDFVLVNSSARTRS